LLSISFNHCEAFQSRFLFSENSYNCALLEYAYQATPSLQDRAVVGCLASGKFQVLSRLVTFMLIFQVNPLLVGNGIVASGPRHEIRRLALSLPIRKKLFWNGVEQVLTDSIPFTNPRVMRRAN
jgi:hypothetical protein